MPLVLTTVWVLWVVVPGVSSRLGGRGLGPSPLWLEGLVGICGPLVCQSRWCWPPLVFEHALANHGGGQRYCRCRCCLRLQVVNRSMRPLRFVQVVSVRAAASLMPPVRVVR